MDDIQKIKSEVEDIVDDLSIVTSALENGSFVNPEDTVSYIIDMYEDTAKRLKDAFDKLRNSIGEKKLVDLKEYGKERKRSDPS